MKLEVISLRRADQGQIIMEAEYENLSNVDMRMAVYSGGANGHDTFLVSDTGEMWPKVKNYQGGGGTQGKVFLPGVKTKTTTKFQLTSGGQDAKVFQLNNWVQLLAAQGTSLGGDFGGWCKLQVKNIPLTEGRAQ